MRRLLATLVTAICGVALLSMYLVPTADAAPYTPKNSVNFNNPAKSRAKERALVDQLNRAISATPRGATITFVMYLFKDTSTLNRLIAAHKRGVKVQILLDDGATNAHAKKLKRALGTREDLRRSFVTTCSRGCFSSMPSTIHGKVYAFTQVGRAKNVTIISSANPHGVNIYNSWNNQHTIVNNAVIYNAMRKYFLDSIKDRTNYRYGNQFGTVRSGGYSVYLYPRRPANPVHYLQVLNTVKCRTAKNMGSKGRTVVRLGMWGFTNPRMDVARKLRQLQSQGCKVDVTLNRGRASRTIMRELTKSTKYGRIRVEDAWRDKNRNDYAELYIHHKALIINGNVQGRNQRVVWTGSQNLTSAGSLYNDDIILRIVSSAQYFAYSKNFSYIQKHYAKRLTKTPPPIVLKSKRSDDARLSPDRYVEARANAEDGG